MLQKLGKNIGNKIIGWAITSKNSLLATRPVKICPTGLKLKPQIEHDIVCIHENNFLTNIRKLELNEKDSKIFENLLSTLDSSARTELREMFNSVINRPNINLNELKKLFAGREYDTWLYTRRKISYKNPILNNYDRLYVLLDRLKAGNLQPQHAEIIKYCDNDALEVFMDKNILGERILPNEYMKKLSIILEKEKLHISEIYSSELNKQIIKCYNIVKDKTYFQYDTEKGILEFFEKDGANQIKKIRNINGNAAVYKINPSEEFQEIYSKLLEETTCIKDSNGKAIELINYKKSNIDGIFNVVKKDLKTGQEVPLSEVIVDNTGKKIIRQNLVSPNGTKTHVNYEKMSNGDTQYKYSIADKNDNTLMQRTLSRTTINDHEFLYTINNKSYNVKFIGADRIEIRNPNTLQIDIIDLKNLLSMVPTNHKDEMISMLKKIPPNELLAINKYKIEHLRFGKLETSFTSDIIKDIFTSPHEFVFLHELGHIKDLPEKVERVGDCIKGKISNNIDFLKIFNKERTAYINKYGTDDKRINYFIQKGSGMGYEGETLAETNALLSTPVTELHMKLRSYLLAENFPETIAFASKYLY